MKKYLLFGVIASVLSINAYAVSATVTSKDYVDAMDDEVYNELDASKQNKIPASGTNSATPGDTVVTYTSTAGTIGERGICNDPDEDDCNVGDLVTLGQVMNFVAEGFDNAFNNAVNNMPTITTSKMTCVDSPDCTLWSVSDQTVYGVCKGYGEHVSVDGDASECCSGFLNGVNTCGCKNNSDCPDGIECVQSGTYRYCNTGGGGK